MPHASKPLAGRAALITGGSRGLGREIARAFVTAGASIMMCAREGVSSMGPVASCAGLPARGKWCAGDRPT